MLSTACLTLFLVVTAVAAEPMRVTTSGGQKIIGHPSVWKPNVSEYLGIRYARAPNIERRWAPPERFEANPAYTIVASKYVSLFENENFQNIQWSTNFDFLVAVRPPA